MKPLKGTKMLLLAVLTALVVCACKAQPLLLALPLDILPRKAEAMASHLMAAEQESAQGCGQ